MLNLHFVHVHTDTEKRSFYMNKATSIICSLSLVLLAACGGGRESGLDIDSLGSISTPVNPTPGKDPVSAGRLSVHPRLFLDAAEWDALNAQIKQGDNANLMQMHANIIRFADVLAADCADGYRYDIADGNCHLPHCYLVNLAYAYKTTGEGKYLTAASNVLSRMTELVHWNANVKFLNTAEIATGVAIACDWLYNDLDEALRSKVISSLKSKCISPAIDGKAYDWTRTTNWAQLCNCAITLSALVAYETAPEDMQAVVDKSVGNNLNALPYMYSPDGNYVEGFSYWEYGTNFQMILNGAVESVYGKDMGLCDVAGVSRTAEFMMHMVGPTWLNFNFSDANSYCQTLGASWYFAWKFNDPSILYLEQARMGEGYMVNYDTARFLPEAAIYCSKIPAASIVRPTRQVWSGNGSQPVILVHTDWSFTQSDKYLAIKGGKASNSHGHMDAGSFVYDAYGIRWSHDINRPEYSVLEGMMKADGGSLWDYGINSLRWQVNSYNNFNHSTVTIDDALHVPSGTATIITVRETGDKLGGRLNLTPLFRGCNGFTRSADIVDGRDLVIVDHMEMSKAVKYRFSWITAATPTIEQDRIVLTQDGIRMALTPKTTAGTIGLKEFSMAPVTKYDQNLAGYHNVGFEIDGVSAADVTVTFTRIDNQ